MERPGWYIIAYDIADPKRLRIIHRLMKKEGIAVQQSVFFVHGTEKSVKGLLEKLAEKIKPEKDDIRAYPVTHPKEVWTTGGPLSQFPLAAPGMKSQPKNEAKNKSKPKSWWRKLLGL